MLTQLDNCGLYLFYGPSIKDNSEGRIMIWSDITVSWLNKHGSYGSHAIYTCIYHTKTACIAKKESNKINRTEHQDNADRRYSVPVQSTYLFWFSCVLWNYSMVLLEPGAPSCQLQGYTLGHQSQETCKTCIFLHCCIEFKIITSPHKLSRLP